MTVVFMASGGGLLSFNTGFAIWVLISMIIFLLIMGKYAVPPIVKALDEREKRIKESLESAERAVARAEKISSDNEKALRESEKRAQQIRKEALEEAEVLRAERIEKAKEDADKILAEARSTIEQEKKRALNELRKEVADLAISSAAAILDAELDEKKNKKLVDSYIKQLSSN
ncbi:MAG: F0F1 ATP synthase subunit B [Balneolaceae bacterium]